MDIGYRCDPRILFPDSFPDGSSNTVLVVEAKKPVPWSKPEDLPYDRTSPIPPLGGLFPDGFHAAMADGSPRFISHKVSEVTLRRAIERNDGQPLGNDW
jgi:hypothetical protein